MSNIFASFQKEDHINLARQSLLAMMRIRDYSLAVRNRMIQIEKTCVSIDEAIYQAIREALMRVIYLFLPDFMKPSDITSFMNIYKESPCKRTANVLEAIGYLNWAIDNVPEVRDIANKINAFGDNILPTDLWNECKDSFDTYVDNMTSIPSALVSVMESVIITSCWNELEAYMIENFGEQCVDSLANQMTKYQSDMQTSGFKEQWQKYQCADGVLGVIFGINLNTVPLYSYAPTGMMIGVEYEKLMKQMFVKHDTGMVDYDLFFSHMSSDTQSKVRSLMRQYTIFNSRLNYSILSASNQSKLSTFLSFVPTV